MTGQWPDVDCGTAKLTTTASQPRCRVGLRTGVPPGRRRLRGRAALLAVDRGDPFPFELWFRQTRQPSLRRGQVRIHFGDIAAALKYNGTVAHKRYRVVGCEPDRQHYTASFTASGGQPPASSLLVTKTARRSSSWAAMAWRLSVGGSRLAFAGFRAITSRIVTCRPSSTP
jgi:hypothetical protein